MLVFKFLECIISFGSQKWMSPVAPYLSVSKLLRLIMQLELWNTTHVLIFIQNDVFHEVCNMRQFQTHESEFYVMYFRCY